MTGGAPVGFGDPVLRSGDPALSLWHGRGRRRTRGRGRGRGRSPPGCGRCRSGEGASCHGSPGWDPRHRAEAARGAPPARCRSGRPLQRLCPGPRAGGPQRPSRHRSGRSPDSSLAGSLLPVRQEPATHLRWSRPRRSSSWSLLCASHGSSRFGRGLSPSPMGRASCLASPAMGLPSSVRFHLYRQGPASGLGLPSSQRRAARYVPNRLESVMLSRSGRRRAWSLPGRDAGRRGARAGPASRRSRPTPRRRSRG